MSAMVTRSRSISADLFRPGKKVPKGDDKGGKKGTVKGTTKEHKNNREEKEMDELKSNEEFFLQRTLFKRNIQ